MKFETADFNPTVPQEMLREAISSLGIDRPVLKIEILPSGSGLRLYLLGGEVKEWHTSPGKSNSPGRRKTQRRRAKGPNHDNPR